MRNLSFDEASRVFYDMLMYPAGSGLMAAMRRHGVMLR
jgi:hypothetical protein